MTRPRQRATATGVGYLLKDRVTDVARYIDAAAGASNRAIARRLFLSERAVERHVTAIFDALGLAASRRVHRRVLAVLAHRKVSADSQLRVA
jgi:DNA-binding NarL/FixJ family response regulator